MFLNKNKLKIQTLLSDIKSDTAKKTSFRIPKELSEERKAELRRVHDKGANIRGNLIDQAYMQGLHDALKTKRLEIFIKNIEALIADRDRFAELAKESIEDIGVLVPDAMQAKVIVHGRNMGTASTKQKAEARHAKILAEAKSIDPEKERSAYSLSEELAEVFLIKRKRAQAKNTKGETLSYVDASYWKKGFKKGSIYKLLKKNGWK